MTGKQPPKEPGTEISAVQDVIGTLVKREGDVISGYLAREIEAADASPEAAYEAIIAEIMGATTIEEVLNLPETTSIDEHAGQTLELRGFRVLDSEFEQGAPIYVVVGGVNLNTNEKIIITCGEQAIMAQLLRLKELKAFPVRVIPTPGKRANRYGRVPMKLKLAAT